MFLYKQISFYLVLIISSVYFTGGVFATDCDVYKKIVGNSFPYKDDLDKVNGNCCRVVDCDAQNNINHV